MIGPKRIPKDDDRTYFTSGVLSTQPVPILKGFEVEDNFSFLESTVTLRIVW